MRPTIAIALPAVAALCLTLSACGGDPEPEVTPSAALTSDSHEASTTVGKLQLNDFWVKQSSLDMSAAFGEIENTGDSADALVKVEAAGVPAVELHETTADVMKQVDSMAIPAHEDLELEPGGNHIMLLGLTDPLEPGETVDLTLTFSSGATAAMTVPVVAFSGDDGHDDNSDHD